MKVVAIQSNYIPWKGYFDMIREADVFVFYDEVKYTKNDWRNRNLIYPAQGPQWLTIPIAKEAVHQLISEVSLPTSGEHAGWQQLHHKTLTYSYRTAPHFAQLKELIDEIYLSHKWEKLSELNKFIIKTICDKLEVRTEFRDLSEFQVPDDRIGRLLEMLTQLKASEYISGPSGSDYLKDKAPLFEERGIKLHFKKYPDYPAYPQLGAKYESGVSILDMIAHLSWEEIPSHIWDRKAPFAKKAG